jgi:hypothetical protein
MAYVFNPIQQEILKIIKLINDNSKRKYVYVYVRSFTEYHKIIDENDVGEIPLIAENEHNALHYVLGVWNEINKKKAENNTRRFAAINQKQGLRSLFSKDDLDLWDINFECTSLGLLKRLSIEKG